MATAAVNGIEVYYEIHGNGDPAMLITGLGGIGESWGPQIGFFAKDFLTVLIAQHDRTAPDNWDGVIDLSGKE